MKRKLFIKYTITIAVAIAIMFMLFWVRSTSEQEDKVIVVKDISDAFSSAGILILCIGGLVFINNNGMFNMFSYAFKSFISAFRRDDSKKLNKLYYEYNKEQQEQPSEMLHFFLVGGIFLTIGLIIMSHYYSM